MFGSHLSISGGVHHALLAAEAFGMDTVQIFTANQQQWRARAIPPAEVEVFRGTRRRLGFAKIVCHNSYLINLAAPAGALRERSVAALGEEMRRCRALGVTHLVLHPGSHGERSAEEGLANIAAGLNQVVADEAALPSSPASSPLSSALSSTPPASDSHASAGLMLCLETTAGQGTSLGHRFEQIAELLGQLRPAARFGVCVDTAHIFAAGYDIRTAAGVREMLAEFDRLIGLGRLAVWHLNDSKKPLGSRVDRHEHIGRGLIGVEGFGAICGDARFAAVPKILETPKGLADNGREWDAINLGILRRLAAGEAVRIRAIRARRR